MFNSEDILTSCSQCVLFLLIIMYFFLYSYVVAGEGSQRISVQILVVHGYLLGRRVSDSTCWSHTSEGQECLEDRMGYKPCDHRLLCNLSIHVFATSFFFWKYALTIVCLANNYRFEMIDNSDIAIYWVQGAFATALKYSLNSWAVSRKGPSYPAMFSPLSVVFTVVLGSIFIGDNITIGRSFVFFVAIPFSMIRSLVWVRAHTQKRMPSIEIC